MDSQKNIEEMQITAYEEGDFQFHFMDSEAFWRLPHHSATIDSFNSILWIQGIEAGVKPPL